MVTATLIVGIACIVVALLFVLAPLARPDRFGLAARPGPEEAPSLERLRDEIYAALVELDFDHTVGKTDEEEYQRERADLKRQALAVLRLLDERDAAREPEREVERLIAAERAARRVPTHDDRAAREADEPVATVPVPVTCQACDRVLGPDDRFCAGCGRAREASVAAVAGDADPLVDEVEREVRALRRERASRAANEPPVVRVSGGRGTRASRQTR